jgi:hypothetical protein
MGDGPAALPLLDRTHQQLVSSARVTVKIGRSQLG